MNSINASRIVKFEEALNQALPIDVLHIDDESHLHAGHAGAQGGAGHFRVHIQSPAFRGLSKVQQHRLVYDALSSWIPHEIHALAIITN
jgi:BolA protein